MLKNNTPVTFNKNIPDSLNIRSKLKSILFDQWPEIKYNCNNVASKLVWYNIQDIKKSIFIKWISNIKEWEVIFMQHPEELHRWHYRYYLWNWNFIYWSASWWIYITKYNAMKAIFNDYTDIYTLKKK